MGNSYISRMRVKENVRITDPACKDVVVLLTLTAARGKKLRPFRPGQFVRIAIPGVDDLSPGYFWIASSPENTSAYEFFVKDAGSLSKYLSDIQIGAELEVEGPMGNGYDLKPFKGSDVFLIGVGTGIAPLRGLWQHIISRRADYGRVRIYAGFLTPLHQLLTDELAELGEHDIEVSVSLEMGGDNWDGPIGYVQQALKTDAPDSSNAVACLAGMSPMLDACTETLQSLGFNDSRILLSH